MKALSLIPSYYGVGLSVESSVAKKKVELALHKGNFVFGLFDNKVSTSSGVNLS